MLSDNKQSYIDTEWLELIQEAAELGMTSQEIRDFLQQYLKQYNGRNSANRPGKSILENAKS